MTDPTESAEWHQFLAGLGSSSARTSRSDAVPRPADRPRRGVPARRAAGAVLVELGDRARRPHPPRVPASERPRHCSGAVPTPTTCTGTRASHPALHVPDRGRMNSCEEFVLAIRRRLPAHRAPGDDRRAHRVRHRRRRRHDFEILLGGDGDEPNRVPLPEGAIMCSIREYYFDWQPREPATFTIEYLGGEPARPPSTFGERDRTKRSTSPSGRSCSGTST